MSSEPVGDVALGLNEGEERPSERKNNPWVAARDSLLTSDNMLLWRSVEYTDPKYVSPIADSGLSNVDATYQKMRATELWGPYGKRWGLQDIQVGQTPETGLPVEIWGKAKFYCPEAVFEIMDDVAWRRGDDCRKKLMTRMLKKALSYLGFSALIYMGEADDDGASPEATEDHEKIYASLKQAALQASNEKELQYIQDQCKEKRLGRFHRSSLAAVCAQRASYLGIEMQGM